MNQKTGVIGVDLGGTKVLMGVIDHEGKILKEYVFPTKMERGFKAIEEEIQLRAHQMTTDLGLQPIALGVGVAGQIAPKTGVIRFAPNLDWHDVPLKAQLESALQLPVTIINDVRAAAWGEWMFGSGFGAKDLVCLFVGTGIGGGIICNGKMLEGHTNCAGEVGHITLLKEGPKCTCGNRGCFEALAGGWAIAKMAQEIIQEDKRAGKFLFQKAKGTVEEVTAKHVAEAAIEGDPLSLKIMEEVGNALIAGCSSLINAFNPSILVLGGGIIQGYPHFLEKIKEGIRERALHAATMDLKIVREKLLNKAGMIGAAICALKNLQANHNS